MEGKMRFKGVLFVAAEEIGILRFGAAKICGIEVPFFVQHFGMRDADAVAGMTFELYDHPAGKVLTEVDDLFSAWCRELTNGMKTFVFFDGLATGGDQIIQRIGSGVDTLPAGVVIVRQRPAFFREAVVDGLAVINLRIGDLAGGGLPAWTGDDGLG